MKTFFYSFLKTLLLLLLIAGAIVAGIAIGRGLLAPEKQEVSEVAGPTDGDDTDDAGAQPAGQDGNGAENPGSGDESVAEDVNGQEEAVSDEEAGGQEEAVSEPDENGQDEPGPDEETEDMEESGSDSGEAQPVEETKSAREIYMSFLEPYEGDLETAAERPLDAKHEEIEMHYYNLTDLNGDGTEDLLTMEIVNMRHEIVRIFTLSEAGEVRPFFFENGDDAVFDNNHQANGEYDFWVCPERHIHNAYTGGMARWQDVFVVEGNTLVKYLTYQEESFRELLVYTEYGAEISADDYNSKTAACSAEGFSWSRNTAEGRA